MWCTGRTCTRSCTRTCLTSRRSGSRRGVRAVVLSRYWLAIMTTTACVLTNTVLCETNKNGGDDKKDVISVIAKEEEVWPYRVCGMSQATDTFRFARNIKCPTYSANDNGTEGVLLIYKPNIVPYIFPVRTFYKEITTRKRYSDTYAYHEMGETVKKVPVAEAERRVVDVRGQCYSAADYVDGDAYIAAFDNDEENRTRNFMLGYASSDGLTRYVTVNSHRPCLPGLWLHKTCTTVNCVVTDTVAKSRYPYDFFALPTGEMVDMSPFYDGHTSKERFAEPSTKFRVYEKYERLKKLTIETTERETFNKMAFLEKRDYSIEWEIKPKNESPCHYVLWRASAQAIMTKTVNRTLHFMARELTATFGSEDKEVELASKYPCVYKDANQRLTEMFNLDLKSTHISGGSHHNHSYITQGGLILVFMPVQNKKIVQLMNITDKINRTYTNSTSRTKRDTSQSVTRGDLYDQFLDLSVAQVQFAYDTIRSYINQALTNIADAWCRDQKRTNDMWGIISKVNPSAALSAIFDKPVSARYIGDIMSVSKCIDVNQESVKIYQTMTVPKTGTEWGVRAQCYSRPLVEFRFDNETAETVRTGQLGLDNEILLGQYRTELCQENSIRYFIAGRFIHVFKDYKFHHTINLTSIDIVDTFIHLNISFLQNIDFQMLRLYTQEEQFASRLLDLETLFRDFNMYRHRIYKLEEAVHVKPYVPPAGMRHFFEGMGAVGSAISSTLGAMESLVSGVASFLKNPFGGTLTIILIGCVIVGVLVVYNRMNHSRNNPMQYYFPYVDRGHPLQPQPADAPPSYEESTAAKPTTKFSEEDAYMMLLAMKDLDHTERKTRMEEAKRQPSVLEKLRHRGYSALKSLDF
ncbi:envelope glycoprotein B [Proboscivirus elephantidbeta4]|uniref:Envelope glycoprotein B n=1 Tax=Elephant endotheliotropic herpesvirus 4 TaxID=548914 RepID=A0A0S1TP73_9BETA|nr:envelope glycoprotein B [Elephant endotheliotropic herpesvirus 4]ALM25981.1 envelope glycoprotein B [Elephant endotheliotropic herpesvirus 4]